MLSDQEPQTPKNTKSTPPWKQEALDKGWKLTNDDDLFNGSFSRQGQETPSASHSRADSDAKQGTAHGQEALQSFLADDMRMYLPVQLDADLFLQVLQEDGIDTSRIYALCPTPTVCHCSPFCSVRLRSVSTMQGLHSELSGGCEGWVAPSCRDDRPKGICSS